MSLGTVESMTLDLGNRIAKLLKRLLGRYGDLAVALSAYNAGPGRVRDSGGQPAITETQDYVTSILSSLGMR